VLTDGTRVDSVPNLEILTGEVVGAGHASASGRLEDHHLFYLMARGIPFADAGQHLEHRLFVDHAMPNCRSRVGYKGALQGQDAHAVWIGDVIIRAEATGTDTYERNRNLVLTDGTRVDSVPNLEILTGEVVGAGHASASGRLEDQHLFYLMARGIPEAEARRLVIRGFFGTLIDRIGIPQVAERIAAGIELELS